MKYKLFRYAGYPLFFFLVVSCNNKSASSITDTPLGGTINISVDESFRPVIDEQIKVYQNSYPGTKIIAHYKPEALCLKDLFTDTTNRMIIVTRGLTANEETFFKDTLGYVPQWGMMATDAIAIIVNKKSNDTLFTIDDLKMRLTGKAAVKTNMIFDGMNATGTVRFAVDSILRGGSFDTSVVKAVANSRAVIDYVAENEDAIGFVGISWIGNPEDSSQVKALEKVKIAWVQCDSCKDKPYIKPNQITIATRVYPLVRGLYYIVKENFNGLGSGFTGFLKFERGQLIFRRAYLQPEKMNFDVRSVNVNTLKENH
ncbi:MAG: substrate-binding domain-containing protein, partial [Ferruginibacter sp.]